MGPCGQFPDGTARVAYEGPAAVQDRGSVARPGGPLPIRRVCGHAEGNVPCLRGDAGDAMGEADDLRGPTGDRPGHRCARRAGRAAQQVNRRGQRQCRGGMGTGTGREEQPMNTAEAAIRHLPPRAARMAAVETSCWPTPTPWMMTCWRAACTSTARNCAPHDRRRRRPAAARVTTRSMGRDAHAEPGRARPRDRALRTRRGQGRVRRRRTRGGISGRPRRAPGRRWV